MLHFRSASNQKLNERQQHFRQNSEQPFMMTMLPPPVMQDNYQIDSMNSSMKLNFEQKQKSIIHHNETTQRPVSMINHNHLQVQQSFAPRNIYKKLPLIKPITKPKLTQKTAKTDKALTEQKPIVIDPNFITFSKPFAPQKNKV